VVALAIYHAEFLSTSENGRSPSEIVVWKSLDLASEITGSYFASPAPRERWRGGFKGVDANPLDRGAGRGKPRQAITNYFKSHFYSQNDEE